MFKTIFTYMPTKMRDSLIRHVLTALGGILIAKGYMTEEMLDQVIGAILALFGTAWGVKEKAVEDTETTESK